MVSKGGVPKGRIIPVYLTDEGDVFPLTMPYMPCVIGKILQK